jgi:hypothetical protein
MTPSFDGIAIPPVVSPVASDLMRNQGERNVPNIVIARSAQLLHWVNGR